VDICGYKKNKKNWHPHIAMDRPRDSGAARVARSLSHCLLVGVDLLLEKNKNKNKKQKQKKRVVCG
jgi:hypothetical protein